MAMTLDELTKALKQNTYTPLTEDEIQQRAKNRYQAELDQANLTAQQAHDKTALALEDQLAKLGTSYDKQMKSARENTAQTYSAADRQALSRGMQRSTFNNSTLANINLEGDETLNRLSESLRLDQNTISGQKTQLAEQLAQQLAQNQKAFDSNVLAYADQLREDNYQKQLAADKYYNELQAMLYEYGLKSAKSSGGGGSSAKSKTPPATDPNAGNTPDTSLKFDLDNLLGKVSTANSAASLGKPYAEVKREEELRAGYENRKTQAVPKNYLKRE